MDRISNLSDDLLLKILSELPTKDVVATMLLSKRWKLLWTMVTKLDFDDSVKEYIGKNAYRKFQEYIDRFLVSHKSPVLETLKFNLRCRFSNAADMSTWIRFAIARRVRELEVNRCLEARFMSITVPACLYTFEKLVALKLCGSINLVVQKEVCLPSLKSLHLLRVQYVGKTYLDRLLAGCPVLEELVLDIREYDPEQSFSVIMPSLERLSILNINKHHEQNPVEYTHYLKRKFVINVPSLKYLNYEDTFNSGHSCSSENMTELVEANVKLVCKRPQKLMRSLTSVKRLSLCLNGSMLKHRIDFCQLVHLELCGGGPKWWNLLNWMLQSSPKLQVLKLNKCKDRWFCSLEPNIEDRWVQPSSVPECLLFHLNTFVWKYYNGREEEKKLMTYILRNARCLKTATFSALEFESKEKATRKVQELVSLPRASSSCKLILV
ncbi:PREDICTED: putative FBD-associated F-box protein At3g50710 [Camelina sativa]|uniref:FBD-associated F-box protein At3g50710 n=1 Tax=Camelina sativa TaxID=90675 RepID=A0ABM0WVC8_CAMSA|nr:PREDICTED: putative FBD-associated F-box protein At3g50710 [Camelina sativa]